jgi:hypothetical protein
MMKKSQSQVIAKKGSFGAFMFGMFIYVVGMTMLNIGIVHQTFPSLEMQEEMLDISKTTIMDLSCFYPILFASLMANGGTLAVFLLLSRFVSVTYSRWVFEVWTLTVLCVSAFLALSFTVTFFYEEEVFIRYGAFSVAMSMFGALFVAQSLVFYKVIRQRDEEFSPFEVISSVISNVKK